MKKLMLAASVCIAASAMAPVAPAGAEKPGGRCAIEGYATFGPTNLRVLPQANLAYHFTGSAVCETLPSREIRTGEATVEGAETLSCGGSLTEEEGTGTLTLGGLKVPFRLRFFGGSPGSTDLAATFSDGGVAVGSGTFLGSESEPASVCFSNEGAHQLLFKAVATGEL